MRANLTALLLLPCIANAQPVDDLSAGIAAMHRADHHTAERVLTQAVGTRPEDARAWYFRGVNRLQAGDARAAIADLDRALALDPADVYALVQRAEAHERTGAGAAARADLRRVLAMQENGPMAEHALLRLGHMAMAEGDNSGAVRHFQQLSLIAPLDPGGPLYTGMALAAVGRDDEAISALEKALGIDPALPEAWSALGRVLLRQGRRQEGCHALQQASEMGAGAVAETLLVQCDH